MNIFQNDTESGDTASQPDDKNIGSNVTGDDGVIKPNSGIYKDDSMGNLNEKIDKKVKVKKALPIKNIVAGVIALAILGGGLTFYQMKKTAAAQAQAKAMADAQAPQPVTDGGSVVEPIPDANTAPSSAKAGVVESFDDAPAAQVAPAAPTDTAAQAATTPAASTTTAPVAAVTPVTQPVVTVTKTTPDTKPVTDVKTVSTESLSSTTDVRVTKLESDVKEITSAMMILDKKLGNGDAAVHKVSHKKHHHTAKPKVNDDTEDALEAGETKVEMPQNTVVTKPTDKPIVDADTKEEILGKTEGLTWIKLQDGSVKVIKR